MDREHPTAPPERPCHGVRMTTQPVVLLAWYFLTFNHITGIPTGSVGGTDIDGTIHTAIGPFGTSQQCETFREAIQHIPGAGCYRVEVSPDPGATRLARRGGLPRRVYEQGANSGTAEKYPFLLKCWESR